MKSVLRRIFRPIVVIAAVAYGCYSCVTSSGDIASDFLALDQQFDVYHASFPLTEIEMRMADSLSGYSQNRITIGSVRDPEFGLTRRGAAISLIPLHDTLDMGTDPQFQSFRILLSRDTMSLASEADRNILQNINVYELEEKVSGIYDINALEKGAIKHGAKKITKSTPVYDGAADTLGIDFSNEFGTRFMQSLAALHLDGTQTLDDVLDACPGIYLETSDPIGDGGRINMFGVQLGFDSSYQLTGNFGEMRVKSTYDGTLKDTSFLFYFSPDSLYNIDSLLYYGTAGSLPQYALNVTSQETRHLVGAAGDMMYVEGGGGLKPVISAKAIRELLLSEISKNGGDGKNVIVNRVSLVMPFEFPDNYLDMDKYPQVLSPTSRIRYDSEDGSDYTYTFAGLTDSSASDENQGDVDRSNLVYAPDITYHAQSILRLDEDANFSNYDIWFLIVYNEVDKSADATSAYQSDQNDYYNSLMYASYYDSMYGGYGGYGGYGYGGYGYGGYGGYGSSYYSNYYSMMMMQQYYSSNYSSSSTSYVKTLDKDRFYHAKLYGPAYPDESKRPHMEVTYSIPKVSR